MKPKLPLYFVAALVIFVSLISFLLGALCGYHTGQIESARITGDSFIQGSRIMAEGMKK